MPRTVESSMRQGVVMPVPGGGGVQTDVVDRSARRRYDNAPPFFLVREGRAEQKRARRRRVRVSDTD